MKKRKAIRKLSRKAAADRLLRAVGCWVESAGGSALVAGSIGIMRRLSCCDCEIGTLVDDPGAIYGETAKLNFYVCIKVTGRRPTAEKTA